MITNLYVTQNKVNLGFWWKRSRTGKKNVKFWKFSKSIFQVRKKFTKFGCHASRTRAFQQYPTILRVPKYQKQFSICHCDMDLPGHAKYCRLFKKRSRSRGMTVKFCKIFSDSKNRFWKFSELDFFFASTRSFPSKCPTSSDISEQTAPPNIKIHDL